MIKNCLIAIFCGLPLLASVGQAEPADRLRGFSLESSFDDALENAEARGWSVVPLSEDLPGQWQVEGADMNLYVCRNRVLGITERLPGGFEEFVDLVWQTQIAFGQPDVKVVSFRSGAAHISSMDARFPDGDGGVTVQLQSIDGKLGLTVNHYSSMDCTEDR